MLTLSELLLINFAALIAVIISLWFIAVKIRDVSFIDAFWAFGMVILSWLSWILSGARTDIGAILLGLVTLWGLRLSRHLFTRWRAHGEDKRYKKIIEGVMAQRGWSWRKTALIMVFLMQAPLLFITCLPAQIGIWAASHTTHDPLSSLALTGVLVAIIGIAFETIGDVQLTHFMRDPNNKAKVLDTGLWRYTRHPNYFGDFATWWGIWLVAASIAGWVAAMSVIGPIFLSFTLMKWSGAPLLERGMRKRREGYETYIARTSTFFPWPPKGL
jgi:steroid 5-alpha reductase family enzyme